MSTSCLHVKNCLSEIKIIKKKLSKVKDIDPKIMESLKYLEENLRDIRAHGQAMEDRLKLYRDGIESMGFIRVKKG